MLFQGYLGIRYQRKPPEAAPVDVSERASPAISPLFVPAAGPVLRLPQPALSATERELLSKPFVLGTHQLDPSSPTSVRRMSEHFPSLPDEVLLDSEKKVVVGKAIKVGCVARESRTAAETYQVMLAETAEDTKRWCSADRHQLEQCLRVIAYDEEFKRQHIRVMLMEAGHKRLRALPRLPWARKFDAAAAAAAVFNGAKRRAYDRETAPEARAKHATFADAAFMATYLLEVASAVRIYASNIQFFRSDTRRSTVGERTRTRKVI